MSAAGQPPAYDGKSPSRPNAASTIRSSRRSSRFVPVWQVAFAPSVPFPDFDLWTHQAVVRDDEKRQVTTHEQEQLSETAEDLTVYPPFWRVCIIIVGLCLAIFLISLDNTILATAIPRISEEFRSIEDVPWYGSAYLLTAAALQLYFGKLYTFFSVKTMFLTAIALFEIGSVICGAAPNSVALIIGRAISGIGCAGIFSGVFIIAAHTVPLEKRPLYTGIVGSMYGVASIAGPLVGGAFTDRITWRWCFYINLPIGAVTIVFIYFLFKDPPAHISTATSFRQMLWKLDLGGLALFIPSVVSILLALQWGGTRYAWSDWRIIILLIFFGICMIGFAVLQWYLGPDATLPARIISNRSVYGAVLYAFMVGSSFFSLIYNLPIWFQAIQGTDATTSGLRSLPLLVAMILMSVIAGAAVSMFGYYKPFCLVGSVFMAIGAGLFHTWQVDTPASKWIGYQIIYGVGIGLGFQQPLIAVQAVLPLKDVSVGTSLIIFAQNFGGAIFLAASQNILFNELIKGLLELFPTLDPSVVTGAGALSISTLVPPQFLGAVLSVFNTAMTRTFLVGAATASATIVGTLLLEQRSVKEQGKPGVQMHIG